MEVAQSVPQRLEHLASLDDSMWACTTCSGAMASPVLELNSRISCFTNRWNATSHAKLPLQATDDVRNSYKKPLDMINPIWLNLLMDMLS